MGVDELQRGQVLKRADGLGAANPRPSEPPPFSFLSLFGSSVGCQKLSGAQVRVSNACVMHAKRKFGARVPVRLRMVIDVSGCGSCGISDNSLSTSLTLGKRHMATAR